MVIYRHGGLWKLILALVILVALINLLELAVFNAAKTVMTAITGRLVPIYKVQPPDKTIALSLDAMWGAERTLKILDILDKYGVKTTFFLGGFWLEKYPEMVKEIARRGHEIGNHTYSHPHMSSLSPDEIRQELMSTHAIVENLTGKRPHLFRPPFGEYNNTIIETARNCGYETIMWSIDSLDWQDLPASEIINRIMANLHPGAIVLLHNNGTYTAEALDQLIPMIKNQGYRIVPVSKLLLKGDYYIDQHSGEQRPLTRPRSGRRGEDEPKESKGSEKSPPGSHH